MVYTALLNSISQKLLLALFASGQSVASSVSSFAVQLISQFIWTLKVILDLLRNTYYILKAQFTLKHHYCTITTLINNIGQYLIKILSFFHAENDSVEI